MKKVVKVVIDIMIVLAIIAIAIVSLVAYNNYQQVELIDEQKALKPSINEDDSMNFSELSDVSANVIGWLVVEDTMIDYPVAQGTDNAFYLNHSVEHTVTRGGTLFLDYRLQSDFSDFNNIIYGHKLAGNDTMFGQLYKYKQQQWFDTHPASWLYTPEKTYRLEIFAVSLALSTSEYFDTAFLEEEAKQSYLDMIAQNAMYYRDIGVTPNDHIISMSTCSFEYDEARLIVQAKMV